MGKYYLIHPFIGILLLIGVQAEMNLAKSWVLSGDRSLSDSARVISRVRSYGDSDERAASVQTDVQLQRKSSARFSDSHFRFEHLTVDDGLPQNEIVCIYQDRAGYMWFGTKGGLARYDGYEFKTYRAEPWIDTSLSQSSITTITELSDKFPPTVDSRFRGLWIGTDGGGLNVFDQVAHKFVHYLKRTGDSFSLSNDNISNFMQDRRGVVWIATLHGLNTFDLRSEIFVSVKHNLTELTPFAQEEIFSLCEDRSGAIWIGTVQGLYRHDPLKNTFVHFSRTARRPTELISSDSVRTIYEDSDGVLWIGTTGGLDCFNQSTQTFSRISLNRGKSGASYSNDVVSILEDSHGFLWVGTKGGGVGMLDRHLATWKWSRNITNEPSSLSDDEVLAIAEDFSGTMWIGTRKGINKLIPDKVHFDHYRLDGSRHLKMVWSICEAVFKNVSTVFVGTQAGLATIDRTTGQLRPFSPKIKGLETLNQYPIHAMIADGPDLIWIGTLGGGLFRFDCKHGVVSQLRDESYIPSIYSLAADTEGILWIGTNGPGLLRFTMATGRFEEFSPNYPDERKEDEWVIAVHRSKRLAVGSHNFLWLGTWGYGLARVDVRTGRRTYYQHLEGNPNSLGGNTVFSIHEAECEPGVLWIGTSGGGLSRFDLHDSSFTTFTQSNGLPDNVVYGILEDRLGVLWLSTNSGLSRFDPRTREFRNYNHEDGLQSNEFNLGAYFKNDRGELFFGGPNGLNHFVPDLIINSRPPRVVLTHLVYPGSDSRATGEGKSSGIIELSYDKGSLSFEVVALHYKEPLKNRYAYMLKGADKEWRNATARSELSYTALSPGEYSFVVKAANCDGVWSTPRTMATIVIAPPFWVRWWFYSLCIAFLVCSVFLFHRSRIMRAVQIERAMIGEREQLRKKLAADFHDEIGHQITAISLGTRLLEHELNDAAPHIQEQVRSIGAHVDRVSKEIRELTWELDPNKDSLLDLAEYLKGISDQLFDASNLAFRVMGIESHFERVALPIEWRRHLTRIFKEAMHNIAKHAKGCKNVTLAITLQERLLTIALIDDGRGFDTTIVLTGNGFANMRNRTVLLNGSLDIISKQSGGTTVRFESKLP